MGRSCHFAAGRRDTERCLQTFLLHCGLWRQPDHLQREWLTHKLFMGGRKRIPQWQV
jgi:hypothetical protein